MEEKKEIKIKFNTLLIIILIIVIIGLLIYIIYNPKTQEVTGNNNEVVGNIFDESNNNEVTENIVNESNSNEFIDNKVDKSNNNEVIDNIVNQGNKENEESITLKGEKFIQFDNDFYELKDIAKDYRLSENIKNYKDFNYDLDGDGIKEKITIKNNGDSDVFKLNGKIFTERYNRSEIYIVDLNEKDNNIEVVIYDDGPSDDPNYTIYSKKGNKMVKQKNIGGWPLLIDKKGTILVEDCYNGRTISPKIFFVYYKINEGKIITNYIDINKVRDIDFSTSLYFSEYYSNQYDVWESEEDFTDLLNKSKVQELGKNTRFKILKFETIKNEEGYIDDYKIYVQLSDGRKGYIFHIQLAG